MPSAKDLINAGKIPQSVKKAPDFLVLEWESGTRIRIDLGRASLVLLFSLTDQGLIDSPMKGMTAVTRLLIHLGALGGLSAEELTEILGR